MKYSFLSELAYHMFELRVDEVAYNDIQKVADHYFEESRIRLKLESLVDELLSSKVIKKKDELYRFCHPYTYNYFVARYLRNNLRDTDKGEAVREKIGQLVRNLHEQDFANIIIFLCYLSQDPMLVDEILAAARSIFHGTVPCKLGQEVSFLNKDIKGEPEVTVMDTDPRVAREASRKQSDELEQQRSLQNAQQNGSIRKSPDNEETDLSEVRHALNTLHVMGQILRNFPGSLKGKAKVGIAVECYQLGLRLLSKALQDLERHAGDLRNEYRKYIKGKYPDQSDRTTDNQSKAFIFALAEAGTRSMISSIGHSVGSSKLEQIYQDVLAGERSIAVRLIDVCVKLNYFKGTPEKEIIELYEDARNSAFTATLLKLLVIESLLKYPPSRSKRQSLLARLGIRVLSPRLLLESSVAKSVAR